MKDEETYVVYVSDDGEVRLPPEGFPVRWDPKQLFRAEFSCLPDADDLPPISLRLVKDGERVQPPPGRPRRFQAARIWVEEPVSSGDLLCLAKKMEEQGRLRRW